MNEAYQDLILTLAKILKEETNEKINQQIKN